MTSFAEAYDALVATLTEGTDPSSADIYRLRATFQERTGDFKPDDEWFESRSRAFWDDALTRGGLAEKTLATLPNTHPAFEWIGPIARAQRGLFVVSNTSREFSNPRASSLRDLWSGSEFVITESEAGLRDALANASEAIDGRVCAMISNNGLVRVALLPGAIFHPADALDAILAIIESTRSRADIHSTADALFDTLLRMERVLRSSSRVKASYAYRLV